ncbi:MAG: hypothetical protein HY670_01720 [Chloroflexi bacterium]|nr:hypothetical protein [Chloroflexota bacterium]
MDEQSSRIPFSSAVETFRNAYDMVVTESVKAYNPSLLLELATRIELVQHCERNDHGRVITIPAIGGTKVTKLGLRNDENDNIYVSISITKVTAPHDHRWVPNHINKATEKAVSELNKHKKLRNVANNIGRGTLEVSGEWYVEKDVPLDEIAKVADIIKAARSTMEF